MNENSVQLVRRLAAQLSQNRQKICTAESCTGGLIAKTLTDLAGSSDWFDRGFVTYSNQAKSDMLSVPASVIEEYGAVSEAVAMAMAGGALRHSAADCAIAVTGVAGPGGGSPEKPVGCVWIAIATRQQSLALKCLFAGDRAAIREATLLRALELSLTILESPTESMA